MKSRIETRERWSAAVAVVLAALIAGCAGASGEPEPAPSESTPNAAAPSSAAVTGGVGLANPASVNCVERGGRLEMIEGPGGTAGVCLFDDGSRCEEWRFFRGECAPGQCRESSGVCE